MANNFRGVWGRLMFVAVVSGICAITIVAAGSAQEEKAEIDSSCLSFADSSSVQSSDQFWDIGGDIKLYHFSVGEGRKVLLVHGGPGIPFGEPWPGLHTLENDYEFIYYHQRGCGKSTRPVDTLPKLGFAGCIGIIQENLGLNTQIDDIERIRKAIGEEKLLLFGHSFGAFLASLYAVHYPENVEGMILAAPANILVMPADSGGLYEEMKQLMPDSLQQEYAEYLGGYFDFSRILTRSDADLRLLNAEFLRFYRIAAERRGFALPGDYEIQDVGGWMVQGMYLSMGMRYDYRKMLKKVSAPVLVIHGGRDIQPEAAGRTYLDAFPNAELRVIEDGGHFMFYDRPEEFAGVVKEFLNELK